MSFRFEDFELDAATRELRRGGERVEVQPRVFDLLLHLIRHRARVVPRKELIEAVWPDVVVGDNSVSQALKAARRAIGDPAAEPRFIETVRGRGLRFKGPVTEARPAREAEAAASADPFVGRAQVRERLASQLEAACAGETRLALLVGEPGIGKTRTAETLAPAIEALGGRLIVGRCIEGEGAPPFWPFAQVLRQLDTDGARRLHERLVEGDSPDGPTAMRFELFDAIAGELAAAAARAPLAVLLDDLHSADPDSLSLLMHVVTSVGDRPLLVLGTLRDVASSEGSETSAGLSELVARDPLRVHHLRGLDREELAELARAVTGAAPSEEDAARLLEQTGGNPLFARHVLAAAPLEEANRNAPPEGVRSAIRHHLGFLPEPCREQLGMAAVLGREFAPDVLERMTGRPVAELLDQLEPAVRGRVLERTEDGRLRFTHGLIFEILEADLGGARRAQLHADAARALVSASPRSPEASAAAIAHHLAVAIPVLGAGEALRARREAAAVARDRLAYAEAAAHLDQALSLLTLDPSLDTQRSELLLDLGDALWRSGQGDRAREVFWAASEAAAEAGQPEIRARAVLALGDWWDGEPILEAYQAALTALPPGATALRARVLARYAREIREFEPPERVARLADEATELARGASDPATLSYTLLCHHYTVWRPDDLEPRLARAREAMDVAAAAREPELALRNAHFVMIDLLEKGDLEALHQTVERAQPWHDGLRQAQLDWARSLFLGALALRAGRVDEASVLIEQAREAGIQVQPAPTLAFHHLQRFALARFTGAPVPSVAPELGQAGAEQISSSPMLLQLKLCAAHRAQEAGDASGARSLADEQRGRLADLPSDVAWKSVLFLLAELAARLPDPELAGEIQALLRPFEGTGALLGYSAASLGPVDLALGICADTLGDHAEADARFTAARRFEERGLHPGLGLVAEIGATWAECLERRPGADARKRASKLAAETAERARALGLGRIEGRARDVLHRVEGVASLDSARQRRRSQLGSS